jgi:DNA-binding transcriptional LysR family regulator
MAASVLQGHNDVAVVGRVPYEDGLDATPFPGRESDRLVVVLPPDHRLTREREVKLEEIREEPLLLREKGSGVRRLVLERFERKGIRPNILLEAGNVDFIKDLIGRGAGIGILGMMSIEEELQKGTLKAVPLESDGIVIYIDVLLAREGYRPVAARSFLEFLLGPPRP